jgi:short-subunit dehydrogenase
VARYGHRAYRNHKVVAISGWQNRLLVLLIRIMPRFLVRKIIKSFNRTKPKP